MQSVNLENGIAFIIKGQVGTRGTIPVDMLIELSRSLQELILSIAKHGIDGDEMIILNNFKIDLAELGKSSVVPLYVWRHEGQHVLGSSFETQRQTVDAKLNSLLSIHRDSDYSLLKKEYSDPIARNEIVNCLYNLSGSTGSSPVYIGSKISENQFESTYKFPKFKAELRKKLLVEIQPISGEESVVEKTYLEKYVESKTGNKRAKRTSIEKIESESATIAVQVSTITHKNTRYDLNSNTALVIEHDENGYYVRLPMVDLVGFGENQKDALIDFSEHFDYIFKRYNSVDESALTSRLLRHKAILNALVKKTVIS